MNLVLVRGLGHGCSHIAVGDLGNKGDQSVQPVMDTVDGILQLFVIALAGNLDRFT